MSAHVILGFAFAFVGLVMAASSWAGRAWFPGSAGDDHLVLWLGEEGARRLDVMLSVCFALGGLAIGLG